MKALLWVGAGGSIGSILRYLVQLYVGRYINVVFPLGTFLINISGCLALGLLYGISVRHAWLNMEWKLLLMTGVCGGFTTFSGYSFEGLSLLRTGQYLYFSLYIAGSVLLGLGATALGYVLAK